MPTDPTDSLIAGLEPKTARAAVLLVNALRTIGVPAIIISGRRTPAQNAAAGGAPLSRHLEGKAFDLDIIGYQRDDIPFWWWELVGGWAEANLGLTWGGRWMYNGAPDVNHFDLRGGVYA